AYGGLLASPILATILILEVAPLKARRFAETLFACLLSSSVAFGIYYLIAGSTFVGIFAVPSFKYDDWNLLAAVPLGLVAGVLGLITVSAIGGLNRIAAPLTERTILLPTIGGILFGIIGVVLPLTIFTGTDQLPVVIRDGTSLGAGLLIAVVFAKMLTFALCEATGFIGGPFPLLAFLRGPTPPPAP